MAAATYQLYRSTKTVLGPWRLLDSTSAVADLVCYLPGGIKVLPGSLPCMLLVPRCADLALRRAGAQAALLATASHSHSERHIFILLHYTLAIRTLFARSTDARREAN